MAGRGSDQFAKANRAARAHGGSKTLGRLGCVGGSGGQRGGQHECYLEGSKFGEAGLGKRTLARQMLA
eukprot:6083973-Alexandrium_andersonii.AAC.1